MKLKNAGFRISEVAKKDDKEKFDLVTAFDTIHDQARPAKVLKCIYSALREGGTFLMQDIAASSRLHENMQNALAPTLYTVSTMHCKTLSLAYGGEGLGTVWGEQKAREKLAEAGIRNVDVREVEGDKLNYYYVTQKKSNDL